MAEITIGGYEAAAAAGVDPWRSRVQLWLEKTGRIERPDESEAMEWGNRLEPVIGEALPFPVKLWSGPDVYDSERGWCRGRPDGFCKPDAPGGLEEALLEIKTAGLHQLKAWQDGEVPAQYVIQGHHYAHLTGHKRIVFACLVGGQHLIVQEVERDDELVAIMLEREEAFVRLVESDTPPEPDGSASAEAMLKKLYPVAGGVRILDRDELALVEKLRGLKKAEKAITHQVAEHEQKIKAALGDCAVGMGEGVPVVRWSSVAAKRLDQAKLKAEYPEVFAACQNPTSYRRFTLS
jgi:putative phage-type endonuclease